MGYEMNPPDPVTTGFVIAATLQAAKQAQDFIAAVSGHPGESLGTILGNITNRRAKNVETIAAKSHFTLLNLGLEATEIPLPVLYPALEAASLQEDSSMQDAWANLLANAADPRALNQVPPSFPAILKELGPRDVKFLDAIFRRWVSLPYARPRSEADLAHIYGEAHLFEATLADLYVVGSPNSDAIIAERRTFQVSLQTLEKHRLLRRTSTPRPLQVDPSRLPQGSGSALKFEIKADETFSLTTMGIAFIKACQEPTASPGLNHDDKTAK
jgi:hypothetical protein